MTPATNQRFTATLRAAWPALLVASLALACSPGDDAPITTEPVWHMEVDAAQVIGDLERAAVEYAVAKLDLGASSIDDFSAISVTTAADGLHHVRLQQSHRGVVVRGSQLIVHADSTTFLGLGGTLTKNLDGLSVEPAVSSDDAIDSATADHADRAGVSRDAIEHQRVTSTLVVVPRGERGADLAWQIGFFTPGGGGVELGEWQYLVDATTGQVLLGYDDLHTLEQASGAGGNPKTARRWVAELDVEPAPADPSDAGPGDGDGDGTDDGAEFVMDTARLVTLDMKNDNQGGEPVKGPLDDIGDPAINDAHGYAEITLDMMLEWMGIDSIDGAGFVIVSRVHYDNDPSDGAAYSNAFWSPGLKVMTYGEGGARFHPFSGALDVVAHEISHGFTGFHSDLIYHGMPGGLNESFSDVAGTIAEFYDEGDAADWLVGEDIWKAEGGLRYLCAPTDDGRSVDHADGFYPALDPHFSSGIANRAFCLTVARLSGASDQGTATVDAVRRAGNAWYTANAGYWSAASTFRQACQGVVDAANALGFSKEEVAHISQSWADVGVLCGGNALVCNDDDVCDLEAGETCASCSSDCGACSEDCGAYKRAKCDEGQGDCSRCDLPAGCGDGFCTDDETDTSCPQDCGCSAEGGLCGTVAPFGCWCNLEALPSGFDSCEERGDCCADIDVCY